MLARAVVAWLGALAAACSPEYNWREVRPPEARVVATFPCKPVTEARKISIAAHDVLWTNHVCRAGRLTFALGSADLSDPALVAGGLQQLAAAASSDPSAKVLSDAPLALPGAMPSARRIQLYARRRDGEAWQGHVALFAKETRVYQATVLGIEARGEAVETFFESLRVGQ